MAKRTYATYHVGLKILLKKRGEFLFLMDAAGKCFDLPGGRIDNVEHNVPLEKIIEREVREELGNKLKYKLGDPLFQFRRHFESKNWHIFITVHEADFLSGDIQLSSEHSGYKWINPKEPKFKEKDFCNKEEYLAFKKYFEAIA